MIFPEKKSALVRLCDSIKLGLHQCARLTDEILALLDKYKQPFLSAQEVAKRAIRGEAGLEDAEAQIRSILSAVPEEAVLQGVTLQGRLHSQALSTILICCFCLESYINALAYFLFEETDYLGLVKDGHKTSGSLLDLS